MSNYFETNPDHIPYHFNQHEFYFRLKNLCDNHTNQWYSSSEGLKVVSKVKSWVESFCGWFGGSNRTSLPNVEYGLLKTLYYGYTQDFMRYSDPKSGKISDDFFRRALKAIKAKTENAGFSTTLKNVLSLLEKQENFAFSEQTRQTLAEHLIGFETQHREALSPIGSATWIPVGQDRAFGSTPITLSHRAITKGKLDEAIVHAESAHNLLVESRYESVGNLYLHIAFALKSPHPTVVTRLEQFLSNAKTNRQYERALIFYDALMHLKPEIEREINPQVLLEYGRAAARKGQTEKALYFFRKAEDHGLPPETARQEKGRIYISLAEEAARKNEMEKAIGLYELAAQAGYLIEAERFAELYMKAADEAFQGAPSTGCLFWKSYDYSKAIELFQKGISQWERERKVYSHLLDGNWLSNYLTALSSHRELAQGMTFLSSKINQLIFRIKEPENYSDQPAQRQQHIRSIHGYADRAIRLLQVAIRFEPRNAEHHFNLGNIYDYLNNQGDAYDPLPHFLKAFECDSENLHHIVAARYSYQAQYRAVPPKLEQAYQDAYNIDLGVNRNLAVHWFRNQRWVRTERRGFYGSY